MNVMQAAMLAICCKQKLVRGIGPFVENLLHHVKLRSPEVKLSKFCNAKRNFESLNTGVVQPITLATLAAPAQGLRHDWIQILEN